MAQNRQSKTAISLDIYGKFHQFAALTCIENPQDKKNHVELFSQNGQML